MSKEPRDIVVGETYTREELSEIFGQEITEDTRIIVPPEPQYKEFKTLKEVIDFLNELYVEEGDIKVVFSSDIEGNAFSPLTNGVGKDNDTLYLYRA
jgi:hypothetical protein